MLAPLLGPLLVLMRKTRGSVGRATEGNLPVVQAWRGGLFAAIGKAGTTDGTFWSWGAKALSQMGRDSKSCCLQGTGDLVQP